MVNENDGRYNSRTLNKRGNRDNSEIFFLISQQKYMF